ncbi:histidinol-phosphate transaminase [Sinanaerobacter chloroacetimidivorans]|uniref:Histidinol-phosphate aminotransferase n=1 Tax=Sinanaerobacter chloroacetimidivorans TaxID=2818044 RepID=A0A8J7W1G9_9FIRM|nr:histidinol-phosphate transaminase [Sinanaerobacter chloroacetimidivorans]MBR0599084.1 histidinol-phosphate transaminase [Sinanaerobacter chloroacetimidivorans]
MTYQLNDKVKDLIPYDAVAGDYKIRLDANESFINPGTQFQEEILSAVAGIELNRYPDSKATELCRKFAAFYGVDPERVVAGNGSDELITVILGAFLRPQDKLLLFSPDFSMYQFYGVTYEKEGIVVEKNTELVLTADLAIEAIEKAKPQAVVLSNPCSPTSLVISRDDAEKIVRSTDALVIIDEAYMEFSDQSIMDLTTAYDNLIILKTCSKALGLAAIRLGFAVSSKSIINALHCVRSPYNVNGLTQAVGCVIFSHPEYIRQAAAEIKKSRDYLYQEFLKFQGENQMIRIMKPETNFLFVEMKDAELIYTELKKESIIVRRLGDFLRITAGTKEENDSLVEALGKIFRRLEE